jgi:Putative auto-transporter adhesin, head GIN domain
MMSGRKAAHRSGSCAISSRARSGSLLRPCITCTPGPGDRDQGQLHHQQPDDRRDQRAVAAGADGQWQRRLTASNIQGPQVRVRLSGSSMVRAAGTVTRLDVSAGGSGDAQLGQLVAREVHAAESGSARIVTYAANTLQASATGSGTIVYSGNPAHVTTSITGSGTITRQ